MAPTHLFGAGLECVLNPAFFGWDSTTQISKVIWWLWTVCIAIGSRMVVAHSGSQSTTIDWLLSLYFTMYAVLGLLLHSRALHLGLLTAGTTPVVGTIPCSV